MISRSSGYYCIENKDQLQHEAELQHLPADATERVNLPAT
jgi:hypothetical protein